MDRRRLLKASLGTAGVYALAGPFRGLTVAAERPRRDRPGQLVDVPDRSDGMVRLALPPGFAYRSFGATGDIMSDGVVTPGRQDGMAAFRGPRGTVRLVRNHEINDSGDPLGDAGKAYDTATMGGATTLEIDRHSRELRRDWVSLNGTSFNCAGGPTPWGTWLSVEETVNGPDVGRDFAGQGGSDYVRPHGYLYEVDAAWDKGEHPVVEPVRQVGRMAHEAVAVDPRSGFLYQTEDQFLFPSGIYRYRPPQHPMRARRIVDGGSLEMLRVRGAASPTELGGVLPEGATFDVDWVPIDEPDFDGGGESNDDAIRRVSLQGFAHGAAKFARPEGLWYRAGVLYFSCTRGGASNLDESPTTEYGDGRGQIWRLDPDRGELTLIFQSVDPTVLDLPDNLTVSPRGTLVICEDGTDGNYVRILTSRGELIDVAKNRTDQPDAEFAGATISPDGRTLFVNIQAASGLTFAIWRERGGLGF